MLKRLFILFLGVICLKSHANLFNSTPKFLPSQQAFNFTYQQVNQHLTLDWQIADGYYLYQNEIKITPQQATFAPFQLPEGEFYQDEFLGKVTIFKQNLHLTIPIQNVQTNGKVEIQYQGCTKGFCYPPETVTIPLAQQAVKNVQNFATTEQTAKNNQQSITHRSEVNTLSPAVIFGSFLLGLGLAFTPCVLPMLPLLSAIVIGRNQRPHSRRALGLSLMYVQGMAMTYTLLGLTVATLGLSLQLFLQSPIVLISLSILFILLALSMFGLFELRLPNYWQQALNRLSQRQQSGSFLGVFVMGGIAGLVASPCTTAPLSSLLLYVAQTGDLWFGGLSLYLLALGMGTPLILITLFGNHLLPKSGEWLLKVKTLFGFIILALPILLLTRILPEQIEPLLWSLLALSLLIWLFEQCLRSTLTQKCLRLVLLLLMIVSAKPWLDLIWQPTTFFNRQTTQSFTAIHSLEELNQQLTQANGKKVMLDLYADWCVACKEFEQHTFSHPAVQQKLTEMVILQIDMSRHSAENQALLNHFQILGLPTLLFFDEKGQEIRHARLSGFLNATDFLVWLNKLN